MCRWTEEEVGPMVNLPLHRHFVGFFNVPVQAPTRGQPFYTPVFRRDVLWYGDVRPSGSPSVRPSVTVFRHFSPTRFDILI